MLILASLEQTVLIPSGAGAPGFAGILHCLKIYSGLRVLAGDSDACAYGQSLADGFFIMPSSDKSEYVDCVIALAKEHHVNHILPITTRELLPLAEAADKFKNAGVQLILSSAKVLKVANDKGLTYDALRNAGLPVPYYKRVANLGELIAEAESGTEHERLIFKPASGNGSRGFGIVLSQSEQQKRNILGEKPGQPLYRLEEIPFLLPDSFETDLLVCEYLPGTEYSVDLLAIEGKLFYALVRTRDEMIGGISVSGRFEKNQAILDQTAAICGLLQLHGPAGMQFRLRKDGTPILIEVNPRLQGTVSSGLGAGINLPLDAVRLADGKPPLGRQADIRWGVRFVRYWSEVFTPQENNLHLNNIE